MLPIRARTFRPQIHLRPTHPPPAATALRSTHTPTFTPARSLSSLSLLCRSRPQQQLQQQPTPYPLGLRSSRRAMSTISNGGPAATALPPLLPPALHDGASALQVYPALVESDARRPAAYPFGRFSIPAACVFLATPLSYVSVNQSPIMPGHVLVMPRSNIARVRDLPPDQLADLWLTAQHVGRVLEERLGAEALTLAIQDGAEAGQKVPCVHIHLIPRTPKDLLRKDDIYDLIEKNVPASVLAVGSAVAPSAAAVPTVRDQPNVALQPAPAPTAAGSAAASSSRGDLRESLDDAKRVIRSRDDQAVEARQFARWMREAGVPQHIKEACAGGNIVI